MPTPGKGPRHSPGARQPLGREALQVSALRHAVRVGLRRHARQQAPQVAHRHVLLALRTKQGSSKNQRLSRAGDDALKALSGVVVARPPFFRRARQNAGVKGPGATGTSVKANLVQYLLLPIHLPPTHPGAWTHSHMPHL